MSASGCAAAGPLLPRPTWYCSPALPTASASRRAPPCSSFAPCSLLPPTISRPRLTNSVALRYELSLREVGRGQAGGRVGRACEVKSHAEHGERSRVLAWVSKW